ncbi:Teichuronic acid biosynthesis protein TuaB [Burkholderiales bacterium]|nr:MAG: lipopolysaccharide biosynthesis protein [Burkholderiales bacterium]CAG1010629.1 Teichuronic acid biosynthesis protein TuaB [Burkholderiales bacterium]
MRPPDRISPPAADTHTRRTLSSVVWSFSRVFGQMVLTITVNVVLLRLLAPADFGLLTSLLVLVGFADLVASLGMGPALTQRPVLTEVHLRVATTLSLLTGTALTAGLMLVAPLVADYFSEPGLIDPLRVLAIGLWFTALAAPSRGLLVRAMNFRRLLVIELGSYFVGFAGVGITLAWLGYGVWSLVIGSLVTLLLNALALILSSPLTLPLSLARRETRELLGFGTGISVNSVTNYLAANVDYLVIGRFLGATPLGLYACAYRLIALPVTKIAATLSSAMFPSFAEIQAQQERLARAYLRAVSATSLATFPVLIGCIVAAEPIIVGLYGPTWSGASVAFQILSIAGMCKAVFHLAGPLSQASGRVYSEVWRQILYLAILAALCLLAVDWGIEAIAWAVVVGSLWMYLAMAHLALSVVGASWREYFFAQRPGLFLGLLVALVEAAFIGLDTRLLGLAPSALLACLVTISALTVVVAILWLPRGLVGDFPSWIFARYQDRLPAKLGAWLGRRLGEY